VVETKGDRSVSNPPFVEPDFSVQGEPKPEPKKPAQCTPTDSETTEKVVKYVKKQNKNFPWPTIDGYDFYEVLSALQKAIRRGQEKAALYWATELTLSEYGNHLWKRLRIIASEDIGIADSNVAVQVRALYDNWKDFGQDTSGELFTVQAVLILVRAPKSRIVDHAVCLFHNKREPKPEIPDHALDKHTFRGKKMGRGFDHFFDIAAKLENCTLPDPYQSSARAVLVAKEKDSEAPGHYGPEKSKTKVGRDNSLRVDGQDDKN
jgi:replication-associated recombination protein RarA